MHLSQMQNSTTSNITMSHTKQHREETFPFDGGLGVAAGVGGIIPAHAGLTAMSANCQTCVRDHPRACGAHRRIFTFLVQSSGSSPRMRGSLCIHLHVAGSIGIIPAHAGLTRRTHGPKLTGRDHPRACGAHSSSNASTLGYQGSSPRMRGSHLDCRISNRRKGIIPAHAGLTASALRRSPAVRDHPRACGAHSRSPSTYRVPSGSSPRMRGSLQRL